MSHLRQGGCPRIWAGALMLRQVLHMHTAKVNADTGQSLSQRAKWGSATPSLPCRRAQRGRATFCPPAFQHSGGAAAKRPCTPTGLACTAHAALVARKFTKTAAGIALVTS